MSNSTTTGFNRGGNALSNLASEGYQADPLCFDFKKKGLLEIGGFVRLRILTLSEDYVQAFTARRIGKPNPKNPDKRLSIVIQEYPELADEVDGYGDPVFGDKNRTNVLRVPCWVYGVKKDRNASLDTSMEGLYYLEMSQGLINSLSDIRNDQDGLFEFHAKTQCPEYDIRLKKVAGESSSIPHNWEFEGIHMDGKQMSQAYDKLTEEVLADVWATKVLPNFASLLEAMRTPLTTLAKARRELSGSTPKAGPAVSERPELSYASPAELEGEATAPPTRNRFGV